jgi:DNA polymerase-4
VGPKTADRLQRLGVRTIGDVRRLGSDWLIAHLGIDAGEHFHRLAHGLDDRPVVTEEHSKQIGHETTFGQDLVHPDEVRAVLLELTEQVAARLRQDGRRAGTVTLKIRYGDFETITRAQSLPEPTDVTASLWAAARDIFDRWAAAQFRPVRLIGVSVSHLAGEAAQLRLFEHPADQKQRRLDAAVDAIRARFGRAAVWRAGRLRKDES